MCVCMWTCASELTTAVSTPHTTPHHHLHVAYAAYARQDLAQVRVRIELARSGVRVAAPYQHVQGLLRVVSEQVQPSQQQRALYTAHQQNTTTMR